jgi:hypothetical protein
MCAKFGKNFIAGLEVCLVLLIGEMDGEKG